MTHLYVLRHGETDWNVQGRLQGTSDVPLNARGIEQAQGAARALAGVLGPDCVIVSSSLARASVTAQAVADAVGTSVAIDPRLIERAYGVWEGLAESVRSTRDPEEHERWLARKEPQIEGYEPHDSVVARMHAALDEWLPRAGQGDLLFVTHGSSARMLTLALLGLPTDTHRLSSLENAAWSRLLPVSDAPWSLDRHNIGADG